MSRSPRRSSNRDKNKVSGWIYGTIGAAIIVGIVSASVYLSLTKTETDRATGCPKDRYESVTVVLIDLTDPINPIQAAALRNTLLQIRNEVPKFGRLEIYPLAPTTTSTIEPLFRGCSPGSGRDEDSYFYGNQDLADRLWRKQFADKVDAVVVEIQKIPPQDNSPLLEGIQSVAVTAFGSPFGGHAPNKRLVIISDMIHHTTELSMYQGASTFDDFKNTQYYPRVKPSLRGAKVDVFLIVRDTRRNVQTPPLYKYWVDIVAASNGFLRHWEPLQ